MTFQYPFALLLPFVIMTIALLRARRVEGVLFPSVATLREIPPSARQSARRPMLIGLSLLALVFGALAAARPQRSSSVSEPTKGSNLMIALDLSRSMATADFESQRGMLTRIDGVKRVVSEFIEHRPNDKIGLVVFGEHAYVQSPLTLDHGVLAQLLKGLDVGIAGDATAIGDGIGLSIKRVRDIEGRTKAIILLTDGANNAGQVNPLRAAKVARDLGIKIHTIGIGSADDVVTRVPFGPFSQRVVQKPDFDEKTMKEMSSLTGGVYFNAKSLEKLQEVYREIDKLERIQSDTPEHRIVEELFPFYALVSLACYALYVVCAHSIFMKTP